MPENTRGNGVYFYSFLYDSTQDSSSEDERVESDEIPEHWAPVMARKYRRVVLDDGNGGWWVNGTDVLLDCGAPVVGGIVRYSGKSTEDLPGNLRDLIQQVLRSTTTAPTSGLVDQEVEAAERAQEGHREDRAEREAAEAAYQKRKETGGWHIADEKTQQKNYRAQGTFPFPPGAGDSRGHQEAHS